MTKMAKAVRKKRKPAAGGHFPKKGERKVDGVWMAAEAIATPAPAQHVQTAADRVDWLRKRAGWPPLRRKE